MIQPYFVAALASTSSSVAFKSSPSNVRDALVMMCIVVIRIISCLAPYWCNISVGKFGVAMVTVFVTSSCLALCRRCRHVIRGKSASTVMHLVVEVISRLMTRYLRERSVVCDTSSILMCTFSILFFSCLALSRYNDDLDSVTWQKD